jgi:hypothetical protein
MVVFKLTKFRLSKQRAQKIHLFYLHRERRVNRGTPHRGKIMESQRAAQRPYNIVPARSNCVLRQNVSGLVSPNPSENPTATQSKMAATDLEGLVDQFMDIGLDAGAQDAAHLLDPVLNEAVGKKKRERQEDVDKL